MVDAFCVLHEFQSSLRSHRTNLSPLPLPSPKTRPRSAVTYQRSITLHSHSPEKPHEMSTQYPMEMWIGSERHEIRTRAELDAALREIDTVGGKQEPFRMFHR